MAVIVRKKKIIKERKIITPDKKTKSKRTNVIGSKTKKVKAFKKPGLILKKESSILTKIIPASLGAFALGALAGTVINKKKGSLVNTNKTGYSIAAEILNNTQKKQELRNEGLLEEKDRILEDLSKTNIENMKLLKKEQEKTSFINEENKLLKIQNNILSKDNNILKHENEYLKTQVSVYKQMGSSRQNLGF